MTSYNAVRKIEKALGVKVHQSPTGSFYADTAKHRISFSPNGGDQDITCIRTRRLNDNDDLMSDYHAGTFHDNISQAIKFIQ